MTDSRAVPQQGVLPGLAPRTRKPRPKAPIELAAHLPVAVVALDLATPHMDRTFDYTVPAALDAEAQPGVRVAVRFAGRRLRGYLIARQAVSEHQGRLSPITRVVSPLPVLPLGLWQLAGLVAAKHAGVRADVLRLAVPAAHVATEKALAARPPITALDPAQAAEASQAEVSAWQPYTGGAAFVRHLAAGRSPRAAVATLPWAASGRDGLLDVVAAAVAATARSGRQSLVVCPTVREVDRLMAVLGGIGPVVRLVAEDGPAARLTAYTAGRRGEAIAVVGTRAAAFAPLLRPGLLVLMNDGDPNLDERHAPYCRARSVLALRAGLEQAGLLIAAPWRTVEAQALVEQGWLVDVSPGRPQRRAVAPRLVVPDQADLDKEGAVGASRLPEVAYRTIRDGLKHGPVLVQVPRAGYVPALACADCREPARCRACHGPLALVEGRNAPVCRWCGRRELAFQCPNCDGHNLRSIAIGAGRTAQELGRAFPGTIVRHSAADAARGVIAQVDAKPALVVATPGAEPVAKDGYAAAVLLDGATLTARPSLDAGPSALRHWLRAASLVRPAAADGRVVALGAAGTPPGAALARWDPVGYAAAELAERSGLWLPPAVKMVSLTGEPPAVTDLLGRIALPDGARVLGPQQHGEGDGAEARALLVSPLAGADTLVSAVRAAVVARSMARAPGPVRVQVDPTLD
ncbi:MAG: hypothetical protein LBR27_02475 [Bifidobacteriaceae bacterium]|nr:hypothetical protein [Bifidobacteriaceae bacterium]